MSDVAVDGVCVLFVLAVFVVSVVADVMCCTIAVVVVVIAFISLLVVGVMASVMLTSLGMGVLYSLGCLCPCMACGDHVIVGYLGVVEVGVANVCCRPNTN